MSLRDGELLTALAVQRSGVRAKRAVLDIVDLNVIIYTLLLVSLSHIQVPYLTHIHFHTIGVQTVCSRVLHVACRDTNQDARTYMPSSRKMVLSGLVPASSYLLPTSHMHSLGSCRRYNFPINLPLSSGNTHMHEDVCALRIPDTEQLT